MFLDQDAPHAIHRTCEDVFEIDHLGGMGAALGLAFAYLATYMQEGRP